MSACVDTSLGQMIHNYELGLLTEDDREKFEIHLLECDYCRGLASDFLDVSRVLRHDPEAHAVIDDVIGDTDADQTDSAKHPTTISKLLLAAAAVLVLAFPIHKYVLDSESLDVSQTIALFPTRSDAGAIIDIEKGRAVELKFFISEGFDSTVSLALIRIGGDTVTSQISYSEFDANGTGTITVPVSRFATGHYSLIIEPHGDSTGTERLQYFFRVN